MVVRFNLWDRQFDSDGKYKILSQDISLVLHFPSLAPQLVASVVVPLPRTYRIALIPVEADPSVSVIASADDQCVFFTVNIFLPFPFMDYSYIFISSV
jgi:hypothetical protein